MILRFQVVLDQEGQKMLVRAVDVVRTLVAPDPGLAIPALERRTFGAMDLRFQPFQVIKGLET